MIGTRSNHVSKALYSVFTSAHTPFSVLTNVLMLPAAVVEKLKSFFTQPITTPAFRLLLIAYIRLY